MSEAVPDEGGYRVETEHVVTGTVQRIGQGNEEKHLTESTRPKPSMHYCGILHQPVNTVQLPFQTVRTLHITDLFRLLFWCVCFVNGVGPFLTV